MKWLLIITGFFAIGVFLGPILLKQAPAASKQYTFINQTQDHSYDDSIRTTIYANQKRAGIENAVVIAESVPAGMDIRDWAPSLFKKLGLGTRTGGKAILYLYVPAQKTLKIEVGYALEGVLPDATVRALEEAAKSFTYSNRYHDFWADLINTLNVVVQQKPGEVADYDFTDWKYLSGGAGITNPSYEVSATQLQLEFRKLPKGDKRYQPSADAKETLKLYLDSLAEGIGDWSLPLLSTGSRVYRTRAPLNRALLRRMAKMYHEAAPFNIAEERGQALAWFKPNHPVLPIFLYRADDGKWRIHEPYSFSLFNRFEDSLSVFQSQPVDSRAPVFSKTELNNNIINWGAKPYLPQPLEGQIFFNKLTQLEAAARGGSAYSLFDLADFLYFESFQYEQALALYERGFSIEQPSAILWRTLPLYMAGGKVGQFLEAHDKLTKQLPREQRLKVNNDFYQKELKFAAGEWRTSLSE
jgi:hypothetical protein